jgi:uncharacterized protein YcfJ
MRHQALLGRLFLVTGVLGGLAMLAYQPAPPVKAAAQKPVAAQVVPVNLIDRTPRATASDIRNLVVGRDPPDHCFEPRSPSNAHRRLACG